jgi:hypothetical protein
MMITLTMLQSLLPCRAGIAGGILFCHVVTPNTWLLPTYLDNDVAPLTIMLLLGGTQVSE